MILNAFFPSWVPLVFGMGRAEVNKIQRLGRILDDKVEVFDDLQRRMEELNANARTGQTCPQMVLVVFVSDSMREMILVQ